jgi:hypothetical protein
MSKDYEIGYEALLADFKRYTQILPQKKSMGVVRTEVLV